MKRVIIDCDPGCDDAIALMFAAGSRQLRIEAVTTCCGNAPLPTTCHNAALVLKLIGKGSIPVYRGSLTPLSRPLETAVVHGETGLGDLKVSARVSTYPKAVSEILRLLRKYPDQITILALAPLTNLARAFRDNPVSFRKVKEIVVLGGTASAPGNKGALSEFNFYVDPEAARLVLNSGVPIRVITLDACYPILLKGKDIAQIRSTTLRSLVRSILTPYAAYNWGEEGIRGAIMYDPLAVFAALRPTSHRGTLEVATVETEGLETRGMLVIDRRKRQTKAPNIRVITQVCEKGFKLALIRALNELEVPQDSKQANQ